VFRFSIPYPTTGALTASANELRIHVETVAELLCAEVSMVRSWPQHENTSRPTDWLRDTVSQPAVKPQHR
jgi:hypothetical protein